MSKYYYFIYQKCSRVFKGYTDSDEIMDLFLSQRDEDSYVIQKVKEKHLTKELKRNLSYYGKEIVDISGVAISHDEEEVFNESLNDYFQQTRHVVEKMFNLTNEYIRLSDQEKTIINDMLVKIRGMIDTADGVIMDECDEYQDYNRYLNLHVMMKEIVNQYG